MYLFALWWYTWTRKHVNKWKANVEQCDLRSLNNFVTIYDDIIYIIYVLVYRNISCLLTAIHIFFKFNPTLQHFQVVWNFLVTFSSMLQMLAKKKQIHPFIIGKIIGCSLVHLVYYFEGENAERTKIINVIKWWNPILSVMDSRSHYSSHQGIFV